jgi:hypothetical protein
VQALEAGLLCACKNFGPIERYRSRTCICSAQCDERKCPVYRILGGQMETRHVLVEGLRPSLLPGRGFFERSLGLTSHTAAPRCTRNRVNSRLVVNQLGLTTVPVEISSLEQIALRPFSSSWISLHEMNAQSQKNYPVHHAFCVVLLIFTTRDGQALQNAARVSLDHAFVASLLFKLRKVSDAPNKDSCGHSSPKNPTNYGWIG